MPEYTHNTKALKKISDFTHCQSSINSISTEYETSLMAFIFFYQLKITRNRKLTQKKLFEAMTFEIHNFENGKSV
jgi:hypothetical protein